MTVYREGEHNTCYNCDAPVVFRSGHWIHTNGKIDCQGSSFLAACVKDLSYMTCVNCMHRSGETGRCITIQDEKVCFNNDMKYWREVEK